MLVLFDLNPQGHKVFYDSGYQGLAKPTFTEILANVTIIFPISFIIKV